MLSGYELNLDPSLHIIEGENETGKSTLSAFIRYMLYGLDLADTNSTARAISRTSKTAEGEMLVEVKDGTYRIERKTTLEGTAERPQYSEECRIVDLASGKVTEGVCPGEKWLGFPRSIYRRIACFGQLTQSRVDTSSMRESIENLLFSGDENINIKKATAFLAEEKERLLSTDKEEGQIVELTHECEQLEQELALAIETNRNILCTSAKLRKTQIERREAEETLRELNEIDACYRNTQLLLAFERLHETRRQTNDVSMKLQTLKQKNSHMGFMPDAEYLTELEVNRRLYLEAIKSKDQYTEALSKVENAEVVDGDIQRQIQRVLKKGGEEKVLSDGKRFNKRIVNAAMLSVLLILLALGCVAGGLVMALPALSQGNFSEVLPFCIAFGVGAILFICLDVLLWMKVHDRSEEARHYYIEYGARNLRELVVRMRKITDSRNQYADHIMELRAMRQCRDKAIEDCKLARAALSNTLLRFGTEVKAEEDILVFTDRVEEATRSYLSTLARLREEKSRLDATASQLRAQLEGRSESAIRAKVPADSIEKMKGVKPEEIAGSIASTRLRCQRLAEEEEMYSTDLELLTEDPSDPAGISEQLEDAKYQLRKCTEKHEALTLALAAFRDADDRLRARIAPRLASHTLELISKITAGRYDDLEMSDDLSLKLKTKGQAFSTELLSGGTKDIAYVALRIAMITLVCREELPPLCLDESFAYLDDNRALEIMYLLKSQADRGMQSLLFTCRAREEILAHRAFGPRVGYAKLGGE